MEGEVIVVLRLEGKGIVQCTSSKVVRTFFDVLGDKSWGT
jgi:hypothetical protein